MGLIVNWGEEFFHHRYTIGQEGCKMECVAGSQFYKTIKSFVKLGWRLGSWHGLFGGGGNKYTGEWRI